MISKHNVVELITEDEEPMDVAQPSTSSGNSCCICGGQTQSHKCASCGRFCHPFCGETIGDEGYGALVTCKRCLRRKAHSEIQETVANRQDQQVCQLLNLSYKFIILNQANYTTSVTQTTSKRFKSLGTVDCG